MKIRAGFVSNSSSSSFLIAYKNSPPPCKKCGRSYPDIIETIIDYGRIDGHSEVTADGLDAVLGCLIACREAAEKTLRDLDDPTCENKFYGSEGQPTKKAKEKYKKMYSAESKKCDDLIARCKKLDSEGYRLANVCISRDNVALIELFEALRRHNTIIVIDSETA